MYSKFFNDPDTDEYKRLPTRDESDKDTTSDQLAIYSEEISPKNKNVTC